jgi:hypothetical protein
MARFCHGFVLGPMVGHSSYIEKFPCYSNEKVVSLRRLYVNGQAGNGMKNTFFCLSAYVSIEDDESTGRKHL